MNNSRIWLVVKPTVGIPMFLGACAIGSFAVHVAVLSNTGWVSDFLSGQELGSTVAAIDAPVQPASMTLTDPAAVSDAKVYFEASATDASRTVVVLPDGRTAYADFKEAPVTLAVARPEQQ